MTTRRQAVATAAETIGESWSFLVMQEAFFGVRTFTDIARNTQSPRATLTDRLNALVAAGVLRRHTPDGSTRATYRLTTRGLLSYDFALGLQAFGDHYLHDTPPITLQHQPRHRLKAVPVCGFCGVHLRPNAIEFRREPPSPVDFLRRTRQSPDRDLYQRGRITSVGAALSIVGDRWSFLIIHELAAGPTHFETIVACLGIARNILTERLNQLSDATIITAGEPTPGGTTPYQLTPTGSELVTSIVALINFADNALGLQIVEPPRHNNCGQPATLVHRCATCHRLIHPAEVTAHALQPGSRGLSAP